jgi:hypothetical protein
MLSDQRQTTILFPVLPGVLTVFGRTSALGRALFQKESDHDRTRT